MQQIALRESADASNKYLFLYLFIFLICTQIKTKADLKWVTTQLSEKTDASEVSNNHQYPLMLINVFELSYNEVWEAILHFHIKSLFEESLKAILALER